MPLFTRSRTREEGTTLFFASDLHGSEVCWRKFVAAADFYGADLLVLGGDFTGKLVVPVVSAGERHRARFMGKEHDLHPDELPAFERRVADAGFYTLRVDPDRYAELEADPARVDAVFQELMSQRVVAWIAYAREKLAGSARQILTAPANDDPFYVDDVIAEHGGDLLVNVEGRVVEIAPGHEMITTGYTNRTPWSTPREYDEEEILAHIDEMAGQLSSPSTALFNLHPPPYGTKLDLAPRLNERLEVVTSSGAPLMDHVGSKAVYDAIERHQPLVGLHGHIHESAGRDVIGRTSVFNPGSEYGEGVLKGALIRIGGGRIHSYQATSG
jgi:Icc-related predicted phosphoesterase